MTVRVVHLITGLGSGGAEMMLYKLTSRLDPARFENTVVSMTDSGSLGARFSSNGIALHTLGMRRGIPDLRRLARWRSLLAAVRPHILQTWLYHADLLGTIVRLLVPVPILAWNVRCSELDFSKYSRMTALTVRALARLSPVPDVILVNSEAGRCFHEATLGYRPRRWELIPNGFDTDVFRPDPLAGRRLRAALEIPETSAIVGMVARYDPMKDHHNFLRAAHILHGRYPRVRFVLAGRGVVPENPTLASQIADLGLSGLVHLLGERSDVATCMPGFDVFSLSSAFGEGFPNVVGEAMACGVPCVVTDVGDAGSIVGDGRLVVPPRDAERLASAVGQILSLEPEQRRALGEAARARVVAQYSIGAIVGRYERLYSELSESVA